MNEGGEGPPGAFIREGNRGRSSRHTRLQLAQHIYDSRDFSPMPILADALQDAGCDHGDILTHCRDANAPHVRGCWVVDLILGKS